MPDTTAELRQEMWNVLAARGSGHYSDSDQAMDALMPVVDRYVAAKVRAELEAGGVSYGVRYPDDDDVVPYEREVTARRDARTYADEGAYVVQRRVGSWTPVDGEARDA